MSENYSISDSFELEPEFADTNLDGEDLFAIFESLGDVTEFPPVTPSSHDHLDHHGLGFVGSTSNSNQWEDCLESEAKVVKSVRHNEYSETYNEQEPLPKAKKQKVSGSGLEEDVDDQGQQRMSHITVERNRRKQMNEHLSVLRSLMPTFYVKRGDQASIIGGVVDYINELQQVLQSLEAKKQRKIVYNEVLSPRIVSSPRPSSVVLSPRKPPLSPRLPNLPISPRTPTYPPSSPYKTWSSLQSNNIEPSPTSSSNSSSNVNNNNSINNDNIVNVNELVANSKSVIADVEVKFSGPNVLLKTVSPRIPGQAVKIISALEDLALEILQVNISSVDQTIHNSFTIKIGIECQLSAEELAQQIQQTFS